MNTQKLLKKIKIIPLKILKLRFKIITKLTLSKLTTISVSDEEINNTIQTSQNHTLN